MRKTLKKTIAQVVAVCLFHNSIAAVYWTTRLIFFVPFPAFADAFIDSAASGESLGGSLMSGYTIPNVDGATGQITLTNGAVAGQTIQQGALFQEIQPGAMDAAQAAYGDASAQGTVVNNTISTVSSGTTQHAVAYQTLMGANTAMPNMYNDPMWQTSDDVFTRKSPLINDMFNGCTKTTDYSQQSCSVHVEDLKTCKKTLKSEQCNVTRSLSYKPVITLGGGNGNVTNCGPGCTDLTVGIAGDNYWDAGDGCGIFNWGVSFIVNRPEAIKKATLVRVKYDDETRVFLNGDMIYQGNSGWGGCELGTSWDEYPNVDITDAFKNASAGGQVNLSESTMVGGLGEGYAFIKVESDPDVIETLIDYPAGCRQRLFDSWPPVGTPPGFVSTGSLNDQASTDWWQCTSATDKTNKIAGPWTGVDLANNGILHPILPDAPSVPPAPVCMAATTRNAGIISAPCTTDYQGYTTCPTYNGSDLAAAHDTCDSLTSNPSCKYIKEACIQDDNGNDLIDPVTGACREFVITYDCGTDKAGSCNLQQTDQQTVCDSQIRCMGGECTNPQQESNNDFINAVTALQTLNETQKKYQCDPTQGECKLFKGEAMECQMADLSILGKVDCCNMPIQGSWIDYIKLSFSTWELADSSVDLYAISEYGLQTTELLGAWHTATIGTVFDPAVTSVSEAYSSVTQPFSSMYESVASTLGEALPDAVTNAVTKVTTDLALDTLKQKAMQAVSEWVLDTFGKQAAEALFSYSVAPATDAAGNIVESGVASGMGEMLASIINVVGIIYAIYQIAKMVVQLIFACTEEEMKLNMLKQQKMCTKEDEIGTYCSAKTFFGCVATKQVYCCFTSPFTRIFQEQARPQLGMNFGLPKAPSCEGLTVNQVKQLDFKKMDFSEWINMLKVADKIPIDNQKINELYNMNGATTGNLPNQPGDNAQQRLDTRTNGTNVDTIRQYFQDNM